MVVDRQRAVDVFNSYVENYNKSDEKVRLKIEHTIRVASLCEEIAKSINLSKEDCNIAWLTGLLHDIGRFEQLRRFGTFNDALSIDHAALSSEILFDNGMIRDFVDDISNDLLLHIAVKSHSLFKIPDDLTKRETMFCNILRDADKVDIFRVNVEFPLEEIYNVTTEDLKNAAVTPEVMQSFYEEHATLRSLKKTSIDNLIGHISLIYELIYPYSVYATLSQGYIQKMLSFKSDNPVTQKQLEEINELTDSYIKRRLSEIKA